MNTENVKSMLPKPKTGGSLFLLRETLEKHFADYQFHFLFGSRDFSWPEKSKTPNRVLLAGDGLLHLSNPWLWPKNRSIELWALSRAHRKLFAHFLNIPEENIGYIDLRVPAAPKPPRLSLHELSHLIIATRMVPNKKWKSSLNLALSLRNNFPNIQKIFFCSNRVSAVNSADKNYLDSIAEPSIDIDLNCGRDWWKRAASKATGLIHLSLDFHEDFGVSVWQGCQAQFTPILSQWGSHPDFIDYSPLLIKHSDVIKLNDSCFLPEFTDPKVSPILKDQVRAINTDTIFKKAATISVSQRNKLYSLYTSESDGKNIPRTLKWIFETMSWETN